MPYKQRGKYRGQVRFNNAKHISEHLFGTEKEARAWEVDKLRELRNPPAPQQTATDTDFESAYESYLDFVKIQYKPKTYEEKTTAGAVFIAVNGNMNLQDITPDHVLSAMKTLRETTSIYRANKDRKNLVAFWNYLRKYKKYPDNPAAICEKFKGHVEQPQYTPPEKDILKVFAAANRSERLFLLCYLQTGARRTEIFRLTWQEDIDFQAGMIRLGTWKGRSAVMKYRHVPMSSQLQSELEWWYKNRPCQDSPYVFVVPSGPCAGQPYIYRRHFLPALCARAGVRPFQFHAIRRYFATMMVGKYGQPVQIAQRFLGHEHPSTTERFYIHNANSDLKPFAELMSIKEPTLALVKTEGDPSK